MPGPNILLIVVDQLAYDAIAALGHPAVLTPHMDALVERGTAFTNAYCSSPLCAPSRASLMTGNLPRRHGVYDNGAELPASAPTFVHHLNRAGYTTVLSGKMHFVGPDQHHGFTERLTPDVTLAGLELTPDWTLGPLANPGTSVTRLRYPPVQPWSLQLGYDEEVLHTSLARMRTLAAAGGPFLLCASFAHPHDPFLVPAEYWERYADRDIPEPRAPARPVEEMHPFNRWIQVHHEADRYPLSPDEVRQARRAYYAAVTYVDGLVGRLVGEAGRLGLLEDTVVVLTSDHGEMLGEHGMWFKRTFFDGSAKVPLVVALPGGRARPSRRTEPVSLIDLTATLMDLADVPEKEAYHADIDGESLRPLLENAADDGDARSATSEYFAEGTIEPMLALRTRRHKYVYVHDHAPLLFDLDADPDEQEDLAGTPAHAEVEARLRAQLLAGLDVADLRERILRSQRERLLTLAGTPPGRAWALEPVPATTWRYRREPL